MNKLKTNEQTQKNEYGYVNQKGNRWFIRVDATTHLNSGFKSLDQFEIWLKEEFKKRGIGFKGNYTWRYSDCDKLFELVSKIGSISLR